MGEDDLLTLTAAYAFSLARCHPFANGNKRTAWVTARPFLRKNGLGLAFTEHAAVATALALAAGELSETT